jgi:glycosyltransferase involved in cell wall biosynthesis
MKVASRPHYADHMAPVEVPDDVALVASYADVVKVRRKHRRIVLMQHGIGQSYGDRNPAYPGGRDNEAVGLFLVPGPIPAERWRKAYPKAHVEVVGSPRLDHLPRRQEGPLTVAATFHWRMGGIPEAQHAFHYFGEAVARLKDEFNLIGHGHPRARWLPRFWHTHGIEYVPDFDDVCRRADVLLFDNTSAGFEFAATGRPVVLMNAPVYRRHVDHGLRFWEASTVGCQVSAPRDLAAAIHRALELRPDDVAAREAALDVVFGYRTGAAERASEVIREWAA